MKTILVVDDDILSREFVSEFLEAKGYNVHSSASAEEALQAVKEQSPNLILMDVLLPQMDGMDATRALKSDPNSCHIPVIATTALAMKGDNQKIINAGYSAHLVKPLDVDQLMELVRRYLGEHPPVGSSSDGQTPN